ncbi:MAG: MFS transporter [Micrococcales bacterium]|nr:MFS transporter [Micrococcales bacterium]
MNESTTDENENDRGTPETDGTGLHDEPTPTEGSAPPADADEADSPAPMTHREVLEALSGILLGMFVSMLATSLISSSLPKIISDLNGSQSSFTWVVTATLLTTTISTPVWGKLADLYNRKVLIQVALTISVLSSAAAGLAQDTGQLIAARAVQGIGAGGLTALAVVLIADIISPRERGRYMGLTGGVMAVSMVGGPLIGGLLTDTIGWRWNFYGPLPFAVVAIVVLQYTLHLPPTARRKVKLDIPGALLIATAVSALLLWVTFAGDRFAWVSWQTAAMLATAGVSGLAALWVEYNAPEPMIPLRLFRNRTLVLSVTGSAAIGVSMFGTSVFLSQYLQLAKGESPTMSGVMTIPMVVGVFVASTLSGQMVSRTGHYKWVMAGGAALQVVGLALMGTIDAHTSFWHLAVYMVLLGAGVGMMMQNFVIAVQNSLDIADIGAGTSTIAFFRTLGGAMGVSVLGAFLSNRVTTVLAERLPPGVAEHAGGGAMPDLASLPAPIREIVQNVFGDTVPELFLIGAPLSLVGLLAVLALREVPLHSKTGIEQRAEAAARSDADR